MASPSSLNAAIAATARPMAANEGTDLPLATAVAVPTRYSSPLFEQPGEGATGRDVEEGRRLDRPPGEKNKDEGGDDELERRMGALEGGGADPAAAAANEGRQDGVSKRRKIISFAMSFVVSFTVVMLLLNVGSFGGGDDDSSNKQQITTTEQGRPTAADVAVPPPPVPPTLATETSSTAAVAETLFRPPAAAPPPPADNAAAADAAGEDADASAIGHSSALELVPDKDHVPTANSGYATSVAIFNNTAVFGLTPMAPLNVGRGSAFVFERDANGKWAQRAKLVAPDGADGDSFGYSVGVYGNTVIVGALSDDDSGRDSGSAHIFVRNGSVWEHQEKLLAPDGSAGHGFGREVAIFEDTVVVGAPSSELGATSFSGNAYAFVRNGVTWQHQANLVVPGGAHWLGFGVGIYEDTAVVGSYGDRPYGSKSGSAQVFVRDGNTWTYQAKLLAPDGAAVDRFGVSAGIYGDTIIVGAQSDDDNGNDSGSAHVFVRSGTIWEHQAKLLAPGGAAGDAFGRKVGIFGDTVVVGAEYSDGDNGSDSGSAYMFVRNGNEGTWAYQAKLAPPMGDILNFGKGVAIYHGNSVVVGSASRAYVFDGGAYLDEDSDTTETAETSSTVANSSPAASVISIARPATDTAETATAATVETTEATTIAQSSHPPPSITTASTAGIFPTQMSVTEQVCTEISEDVPGYEYVTDGNCRDSSNNQYPPIKISSWPGGPADDIDLDLSSPSNCGAFCDHFKPAGDTFGASLRGFQWFKNGSPSGGYYPPEYECKCLFDFGTDLNQLKPFAAPHTQGGHMVTNEGGEGGGVISSANSYTYPYYDRNPSWKYACYRKCERTTAAATVEITEATEAAINVESGGDPVAGYDYVGDGACMDGDRESYPFISTMSQPDTSACGLSCDRFLPVREEYRGFSWSIDGSCRCYFDYASPLESIALTYGKDADIIYNVGQSLRATGDIDFHDCSGRHCYKVAVAGGVAFEFQFEDWVTPETPTATTSFTSWEKQGQGISGKVDSVSLSANGMILAISETTYDDSSCPPAQNQVKVYAWDEASSSYKQIGATLEGHGFGLSLSLSGSGKVLAIGMGGYVEVYRFDDSTLSYRQLGQSPIYGETENGGYGSSLSLSTDGKTLAVGAFGPMEMGGPYVKIYQWNEASFAYIQLGETLKGKYGMYAEYGRSLSLSADGKILAVATLVNFPNSGLTSGNVDVYWWDDSTLNYQKAGESLIGEEHDFFGNSLSLSADGKLLAVGAPGITSVGNRTGFVRIYAYDEATSNYRELEGAVDEDAASSLNWWEGALSGKEHHGTLYGDAADDNFGFSVSLSADGRLLAVGAKTTCSRTVSSNDKFGYVRMFGWDDASSSFQQMHTINGEADDDSIGTFVSLSADGKTVASVGGCEYNLNAKVNLYQISEES